jgi:hypothetical protein
MSEKYIKQDFKKLFENSQRYKQLSILRRKYDDTIETDLKQKGCGSVN